MRKIIVLVLSLIISAFSVFAQTKPVSEQLADTAMNRLWLDDRKQPGIPPRWNYEQGVILKAIDAMWYATGDVKYFNHIQKGMDYWIDEKGNHKDYKPDEYNIDHVTPASGFLLLYRATGNLKYKVLADQFRTQLKNHPRTREGGFWHKKIYPNQMWLDGLYMGEPFYAEYSLIFGEDNWNDIANQFVWMEKLARDPKTGLLYHGWDESKQQKWADKTTGRSPHAWGRAMGWYAMALVDVLEFFPKDNPRRAELVAILNRTADAIKKVQDKSSGVWYDILDMPTQKGNYHESSASAMFVFAVARGVREGFLPDRYMTVALKGWAGIKKEFIHTNDKGQTDWEGTVSVSGLGGNPYRDGSFEYYMSEKLRTNDAKGLGPAIRAALEMEAYERGWSARGKTVLLDDYFNHEIRKGKLGKDEVFHYKIDERLDSGYSIFMNTFRTAGAKTAQLSEAPSATNLANANVYIIVDPDTDKETANPKYMEPENVKVISEWVKKGGVLALFANDLGNCELDKFNELAKVFGISFNKDSKYKVLNNDYTMGRIKLTEPNTILKTAKEIYVKEISTLSVKDPAKSALTVNGDIIMATAKYGKGTVFVIGDPWLYNEYTDGRRLPYEYENFKAAQDLSNWLIAQSKGK